MCKVRQLSYSCGHACTHRISRCSKKPATRDYVCSRLDYMPGIKIAAFCAPCSRKAYDDAFYQQYLEVERSSPSPQIIRQTLDQYTQARRILSEMCPREGPLWSRIAREGYARASEEAAAAPAATASAFERWREGRRRREVEIARYHLRRRQGSCPPAIATTTNGGGDCAAVGEQKRAADATARQKPRGQPEQPNDADAVDRPLDQLDVRENGGGRSSGDAGDADADDEAAQIKPPVRYYQQLRLAPEWTGWLDQRERPDAVGQSPPQPEVEADGEGSLGDAMDGRPSAPTPEANARRTRGTGPESWGNVSGVV